MTLKQSLLSLAGTFVSFVKADFHRGAYLYTAAVVAAGIFLNYRFGFYAEVLRSSYASGDSVWRYPLFYTSVYFAVAVPVLLIRGERDVLCDWRFYARALFFTLIYGVSIGYYGYREWKLPGLTGMERHFLLRVLGQVKSVVFIVLPLAGLKLWADRRRVKGFYGLTRSTEHLDAYGVLLLLLLPFLAVTSFTPDFVRAYPQFRPWVYEDVFGLSEAGRACVLELSYAADFVVTELFFRGALVIGLASVMGRKAVLPMVAFYAAIHFGKPVVETISSVFGGYILGVLAYQTRHIWGGVIVHIGIALTMEAMGFIQHYLLR